MIIPYFQDINRFGLFDCGVKIFPLPGAMFPKFFLKQRKYLIVPQTPPYSSANKSQWYFTCKPLYDEQGVEPFNKFNKEFQVIFKGEKVES